MFNEILNSNDIRGLILNAHKIKKDYKCENCNGTGMTNWNGETGDDEKPGPLRTYDSIRIDGDCEKCQGIGYNIFDFIN